MPKVGGLLDVIRRDGLGAGLAQYVDMSSLAGIYSPTRPSLSDKAASANPAKASELPAFPPVLSTSRRRPGYQSTSAFCS